MSLCEPLLTRLEDLSSSVAVTGFVNVAARCAATSFSTLCENGVIDMSNCGDVWAS